MAKINKFFLTSIKIILITLSVVSCVNKISGISEEKLEEIEFKYGQLGRQRIEDWRYLIEENRELSDQAKLVLVNDYINQVSFKKDLDHWQEHDYWATPIETIASNGGDCEDYSLAKYFTLSELGVAEQCLRMIYVKAMPI